jgi:hypothetical protein
MSRQPLALRANHPRKAVAHFTERSVGTGYFLRQGVFRVTQSLADVADQKVIREDAESLLASVRYNSGHILKIPLQSREFLSVSSCRRQ